MALPLSPLERHLFKAADILTGRVRVAPLLEAAAT